MAEDDDSGDAFAPWTASGVDRLLAAGEALAEAVREHARVLASLVESQSIQSVFAANDDLLAVVLAYGDAQFELTGNGFPFGALHAFLEDDEDDEDEADDFADAPMSSGLTVLSRQDFALVDEGAALAAGRAAYQAVWPDDPPAAAAEDVTHIGRALYQYAHQNGWDQVKDMPGLVPTGAVTVVHANDELLGGDPDEWPVEPFVIDAPVVYTQSDVYG